MNVLDERKKNRRKVIRVILQVIILFVAVIFFGNKIFNFKHYKAPPTTAYANDESFIALTYFGVGRIASPKLVSREMLDKQLGILHKAGYTTISQDDVINFYNKNAALPDKALFLSFEDGRNDSALFSQPLLEKYNYKASMLTYGNRLGDGDNKFLQPKELKSMEKTGYFEMGSNGYRLSYINVVTDDQRYLGEKEEKELPNKVAIEYYNHYLMDFERDKNMIPKETAEQMEKRITKDYSELKKVYTKELEEVPKLYMIMHANTMYNTMNELVEQVNDKQIKSLFSLHFNREGSARNTKEDEPYNLTRLQINPGWSMNQFIMRVNESVAQPIPYEFGDKGHKQQWRFKNGVAQFEGNRIILTSLPDKKAKMTMKQEQPQDIKVTATLKGKVMGEQSVYLRQNAKTNSYLRVSLKNNYLRIYEKQAKGTEQKLVEEKLNKVEWKGEDYAFSKARTYSQFETLQGSTVDKDEYPVGIDGNRKLTIELKGKAISVIVDDLKPVTATVDSLQRGTVALGAAPYIKKTAKETHNERLIYDAIFDDVTITEADNTLYTMKYSGIEKVTQRVRKGWGDAVTKTMELF